MRSSTTFLRLFRTSSGHLPRTRNIIKASSPFRTYRPSPLSSRISNLHAYTSRRYNSSASDTAGAADPNLRPLTDRVPSASTDAANAEQNAARRAEEPAYRIVFTCKPCGERSDHQMSKHGYHKGTVLITCPSCSARHVISDHLGIFMDEKSSLEDILGTKGMSITKGVLNDDLEIWEDGSVYKAGSHKEGVDISSDVSPKETP
jgi:mitochondrial protein import protein ZIM17